MDPLSITVSTLTLVTKCVKAFDTIAEYYEEFNRADINLRGLAGQCSLFQLALSKIRDAYQHHHPTKQPGANRDAKEANGVLLDCKDFFDMLLARVEPLLELLGEHEDEEEDGSNKMTVRDSIKAVWRRGEIEFFSQTIHKQTAALTLLLMALQQYGPSFLLSLSLSLSFSFFFFWLFRRCM